MEIGEWPTNRNEYIMSLSSLGGDQKLAGGVAGGASVGWWTFGFLERLVVGVFIQNSRISLLRPC